MLGGNTIEFARMPLDLVPKILNPVDVVFPIGKQNAIIDPIVFKLRNIQRIIATLAIGTGTTRVPVPAPPK